MKVLATAVKGQLGYDVCKALTLRGVENRGIDIDDFDIMDAAAVRTYIEAYRPDEMIHCSAWTAVDKAENEPERAFAVNADGTRISPRFAGTSTQRCSTFPWTMSSRATASASTSWTTRRGRSVSKGRRS